MTPDPRPTPARDGPPASPGAGGHGDGVAMRVVAAVTPILREPRADAEVDDELLFGERFEALSKEGGFVFGQARRDGYVGYVDPAALAPAAAALPTHRVAALRAYAFAAPDFKAPATGPFSMNSLVTVVAEEDRYRRVEGAGWFAVEHLAPIRTVEAEPAAIAQRFVGAPYLWGGRTSVGLDCSGLVQQALYACGRTCPRDSDLQQAFFPAVARAEARRGDLVFWPGHVGLLLDAATVIHANARTMDVAVEALEAVNALRAAEGPPSFARIG